jgi:hypothetical protein
MTEQEEMSQGLVNNLPFIVSFFSLGVPAGLAIYWVANNILTTLITVAVKSGIKDEPLSMEVEEIMAVVERGGSAVAAAPRGPTPSQREFRGGMASTTTETPKKTGFAEAVDVDFVVPEAGSQDEAASEAAAMEDPDAPKGPIGKALKAMNATGKEEVTAASALPPSAETQIPSVTAAVAKPKRKKRPSKSKKGNKK